MITIEELNKVKESRKSNLYYEEKEYLQYIFLNSLSKKAKDFIFKGGTALRICFDLERASEDLDFSSELKISEIKKIFIECLKDFELLNIPHEIYAEKKFQGNVRFEVRFKGPLYNGNINSTNTLKVDFNSQVSFNKKAKVIPKIFSDVPSFVITALDEKEILAEKIRALINRGAPKDLYDLWFLFSKGTQIDKKLIERKLAEEKSEYKNLRFPSKREYEISLKQLVNFLPEYEQVKKEVSEKIEKILKK
ncbi:MAG: nucleotidyl transferase AbiEii/AbiGii toxin family protein [Nanoarchaeota archaeon]